MAGAVDWGGQRTGSQAAGMRCTAGDALPCPGVVLGLGLSPPGAVGAGQGWLLPTPAKGLGLQCPTNAASKPQSWWLWGSGVPSKGALPAPALPLGSCSMLRLPWALLGGRKGEAAVALCCWAPPAASPAAPSRST